MFGCAAAQLREAVKAADGAVQRSMCPRNPVADMFGPSPSRAADGRFRTDSAADRRVRDAEQGNRGSGAPPEETDMTENETDTRTLDAPCATLPYDVRHPDGDGTGGPAAAADRLTHGRGRLRFGRFSADPRGRHKYSLGAAMPEQSISHCSAGHKAESELAAPEATPCDSSRRVRSSTAGSRRGDGRRARHARRGPASASGRPPARMPRTESGLPERRGEGERPEKPQHRQNEMPRLAPVSSRYSCSGSPGALTGIRLPSLERHAPHPLPAMNGGPSARSNPDPYSRIHSTSYGVLPRPPPTLCLVRRRL